MWHGRDGAPITERHVQAIWFDSALRPAKLRTIRGGDVKVVDPGMWNLEAGPDFRHAVLELGRDGRRVEGDVEVHLKPSDWTLHGHGDDPAYRNVVAHVVWYQGEPPEDLPSGCISVCVGNFLRSRTDFSPDEIDVAAYPYAKLPATERPCERFFGRNPDFGLEILREAGQRRLRIKARRLQQRFLRVGDPEQVFYEEMFAAFGYARNSIPFRALAERLPLQNLPVSGESALEALKSVASLEIAGRHPWRLANVRPQNRPEVRMADAAALFTGGKPRYTGVQFMAVAMANVIVPYALARRVVKDPPRWLPPECVNSVMRQAAFRLFGRDHNPALYSGNGVLLQGLIQIHRDYCLAAHPDCSSCGLVAELEGAGMEREVDHGNC
jgi:hypothetical protein